MHKAAQQAKMTNLYRTWLASLFCKAGIAIAYTRAKEAETSTPFK